VVVDQLALFEASVEQLRDTGGPVRIAGQQHQRRVLADLGAQMDLGHVSLSPGSAVASCDRRRV
jgi:hypothetical protein